MSDWELIQQYTKTGSETAFSELVQRHLAWVYSVALRQVGQAELAEEIAQSVFLLLARKADSLPRRVILSGWLFRTTRFVASRARRAEIRRLQRHQSFSNMTASAVEPDLVWEQLAPYLEQAVAALSESDRAVVLLRFYEKKSLLEVGRSLGITEEAAKKRVSRAVDKLRKFLARRGVTVAAAAFISVLTAKTVQAAPASLAPGIIATTGKSALAITPRLVQETLRAWRWAKIKLAAGIAVGSAALVLLVGNSSGLFTRRSAPPPPSAIAEKPVAQPAQSTPIAAAPKTASLSPKKTGAITGVVLDDAGSPIWGATVWGGNWQQPFARDTTDQSGQFALDKLGEPSVVTVSVDGFATDQQEFNASNAPEPLVFKLSRIPPLVVRVVDESGRGVAGVELAVQQWWGRLYTLAFGSGLPQQTDAEGRIKWTSPPKGELEVHMIKLGYRYSRTNKFTADGIEHTIVLHPTVRVQGSVTDEDTGAPIPAFKLTLGQAQMWAPTEERPLWDLRRKPGSNGVYRVTIDEEQKPYLRLEADGYETLESEILLTNETEVTHDFHLKPLSTVRMIRGKVLLSDGNPVAGVEVALCTAEAGVRVRGTAFVPGIFGNYTPSQSGFRRTTDAQGSFSFAPKPGAHTVVAISSAGIGQARCFDTSQPLEIRLKPWGRVEGTVRTRDGNWGGQAVHWNTPGKLAMWMSVYYEPDAFSTHSDETGAFTLEHVPSGVCRVSTDEAVSQPIEVIAGQTAHVQVGGVGRAVTGKLIAPPGNPITDWTNQVTLAALSAQPPELPENFTGSDAERRKLEFEDSPAGSTWAGALCFYNFKVGADGSFKIPEVLPGKYNLMVFVAQGSLGSGSNSRPRYPNDPQIAQIRVDVTVPEDSGGNGPQIDLGEIVLHAQH